MSDGGAAEDGFTLLEVVCVVAIVAILAALVLPRIPLATSRPRLEAFAVNTARLLKADRYAAIRRHQQINVQVDVAARTLRSGSTGQILRFPDDVVLDAALPERCNNRPALSAISFFASGMSCGGTIGLSRPGVGFEVRTNWLTGGIEIAPRDNK